MKVPLKFKFKSTKLIAKFICQPKLIPCSHGWREYIEWAYDQLWWQAKPNFMKSLTLWVKSLKEKILPLFKVMKMKFKAHNWLKVRKSWKSAWIKWNNYFKSFGGRKMPWTSILSLFPWVRVPPKLKMPMLDKFDGTSCRKAHLKMYTRALQPLGATAELLA